MTLYQKPPRSDELYHHGILGQKWGVRRFQNKDGSLTPEGIKRLSQYRYNENKEYKEKVKDRIVKSGIQQKDDYDVIKKGSNITRYANSGEKVDKRSKYGSLTGEDQNTYYELVEALRADMSKAMSTYTYEATKDIKVASGKKVLNDLIETYGDEKTKRVFSESKELGNVSFWYHNDLKKWEKNYFIDSENVRSDFLKNVMKERQNEIIERYKKQGYDAIVDVEDWYTGVADYPVLFLDPSRSMKLKKEDKWG